MNNLDYQDLAEKLATDYYGNFFNYLHQDAIIDEIWSQPNSKARLEGLIADVNVPMKARFLASQVLFKKHFTFVNNVGVETVAEILVHAFLNNYTGMANSWGFLYEENDAGLVGIHLILMGDETVPILAKLLDNDSPSMLYVGSQEATLGNSYQYRVKDFAAYYISKIKNIPIQYHREFDKRDAEIEKLKAILAQENK
jgi:hypothetical protein